LKVNKNRNTAQIISEATIPTPAQMRFWRSKNAQHTRTVNGKNSWNITRKTTLLLILPQATACVNLESSQN
jgi:hypothetical protein